ncbi:MAG: hypothetical protein EXS17_07455 [Phycisphaerales bacterium]|nr:hypothetical protein [Phycisphaerales bacterium]
MLHALLLLIFVASMVAVGIFVWKLTKIQEAGDPKFQAKLDADDARARDGRAAKVRSMSGSISSSSDSSSSSSPDSTPPASPSP